VPVNVLRHRKLLSTSPPAAIKAPQSRSEALPSQHKGAPHPPPHSSKRFPPGQRNGEKGPEIVPLAALLPGSPHGALSGWLNLKMVFGGERLGGWEQLCGCTKPVEQLML